MGCHCSGRERLVDASGQSSLEYALVTAAVLAVAACFGAFLELLDGGVFTQGVVRTLARRIPEGVLDILMF